MSQTHKNWEIEFRGETIKVDFVYYGPTYASRHDPGDSAEIELLSIRNNRGEQVPVPDIIDDGGNGDAEAICRLLFDSMIKETEAAMATIAIEPWD